MLATDESRSQPSPLTGEQNEVIDLGHFQLDLF